MTLLFEDRILPDGTHVLVPIVRRPRTCERADHVAKRTYTSRKAAKAARTKHHHLYRCPNCGEFHLASK